MRILVLNGPNLNLIGTREPDIYGATTLKDIQDDLRAAFPDVDLEFQQSNHEGVLIDHIQNAVHRGVDGIVMNAGGYTHTSVALRDVISAVGLPVIEVHLSNTFARESFRHHSYISAVCRGVIAGLGPTGYRLGVQALIDLAKSALK